MSEMIEPLDESGQQRVRERTGDYIQRAAELFERDFDHIEVRFDLRGRAAGMFVFRHGLRYIRYNPWIFAKYFDDNLATTVPHEVSHYIIAELYGCRGVRPHGPEWKALMHCFGADPSVTADFDLSGIPQRRERRHLYRCHCREHQLTTRKHNTIVRGRYYYACRHCNGRLVHAA